MVVDGSVLALFAIICVFIAYIFKEGLAHMRATVRTAAKNSGTAASKQSVSDVLDSMENLLVESIRIRDDALKKGAKPEQLQALNDEINRIQFFVKYRAVVEWLEPYAGEALKGFIKNYIT